jgi:hypothetical protein
MLVFIMGKILLDVFIQINYITLVLNKFIYFKVMNGIIFLIILLAIYYYIYNNHYDRFEEKYHYYFYGFIVIYLIILYIYHFEYGFFYRIM